MYTNSTSIRGPTAMKSKLKICSYYHYKVNENNLLLDEGWRDNWSTYLLTLDELQPWTCYPKKYEFWNSHAIKILVTRNLCPLSTVPRCLFFKIKNIWFGILHQLKIYVYHHSIPSWKINIYTPSDFSWSLKLDLMRRTGNLHRR